MAWDKAWKNQADPSGRAIADVHDNAYDVPATAAPAAAPAGSDGAVAVANGVAVVANGVSGKDVEKSGRDQGLKDNVSHKGAVAAVAAAALL